MFLVQEPPPAPSTDPRSGAPCFMLATQPGTHTHSAARPKKLLRRQTIQKQNRIWTKKGGGWQRTGGPAHNKVSLVASPCLPRFRPPNSSDDVVQPYSSSHFTSYLDTPPTALTSHRPATSPLTHHFEQKLVDGNAPMDEVYGCVHRWKIMVVHDVVILYLISSLDLPTAPTSRRPAPPTWLECLDRKGWMNLLDHGWEHHGHEVNDVAIYHWSSSYLDWNRFTSTLHCTEIHRWKYWIFWSCNTSFISIFKLIQ